MRGWKTSTLCLPRWLLDKRILDRFRPQSAERAHRAGGILSQLLLRFAAVEAAEKLWPDIKVRVQPRCKRRKIAWASAPERRLRNLFGIFPQSVYAARGPSEQSLLEERKKLYFTPVPVMHNNREST
jgi:hypothetical protein